MTILCAFVIAVLGIIAGLLVLLLSRRQRSRAFADDVTVGAIDVEHPIIRAGRLSLRDVRVRLGVAIIFASLVPLSLCVVFRPERTDRVVVVDRSVMGEILRVVSHEYIERGNGSPSFDEEDVQRSMSRAKEHFDAGRYEESRLDLRDAFEETIDVIEFASRVANNIADTLLKCGENESAKPWARLAVILDDTEEAHLRTLSATNDSP